LSRLDRGQEQPLTILVATSGDTGGAVAAAFDDRAGMRVVILYPQGRVSERQEHQLTCWSSNVLSVSVRGSFDDCQSLVKAAMADKTLHLQHRFSSANSINIGRLLPQATYYAHSSIVHYRRTKRRVSYIVPTGNLGNAFAAIMARAMGLPIDRIVLAVNANTLVADYLDGSDWEPRASIQTLASAMDVGNPSNMERLRHLLGDGDRISQTIGARSVSDSQIEQQIQQRHTDYGFAICPHTATATFTYDQLSAAERAERDWILVSTAHPAKFEQIVEPLIGQQVPLPDALAAIMSRPSRKVIVEPTMDALAKAMNSHFAA
jgi:threonine synthase